MKKLGAKLTQLKRLETKLKYDVRDRDQLCNLTPKTKTKARSCVLGKNKNKKSKGKIC